MNTLTDRALWRRYTVRFTQPRWFASGCSPQIYADGWLDVYGAIVETEDQPIVYGGYTVPEPLIPPSPRSALAPTHDGNPLVGLVGLAGCIVLGILGIWQLWELVAWAALSVMEAIW
jgi:hypothetical protein